MKKRSVVLMALFAAICLAFGLAACAPEDPEWKSDGTSHWHASAFGLGNTKDKAAHTYVNGVCSVCNYAHKDHTFGNWEQTQAPTCTESGMQKHICSVCSHEESEPAQPLGHEFSAENRCVRYEECGTKWEYTDGLVFELNENTDAYTVSGIGAASGDVVIPYGYNGKFVTAIAQGAFGTVPPLRGSSYPTA